MGYGVLGHFLASQVLGLVSLELDQGLGLRVWGYRRAFAISGFDCLGSLRVVAGGGIPLQAASSSLW